MSNQNHVEVVQHGPEAINNYRKIHTGTQFDLSGADFSGKDLRAANLYRANLRGANFTSASLHEANLSDANLRRANLNHANIQKATLSGANLDLAMLLNVVVDASTNFANVASVDRCKISRLTLESLKDYGGLTVGQRVGMDIVNDVATLRKSFSGIQFWSHLGMLLIFFVPYLRFLVWAGLRARFAKPAPDEITVFGSLICFICSGGREWTRFQPEFFPCANFVVFLTYNLLRAFLLWKTKELEIHEEATGLPSKFLFSNSPGWNLASNPGTLKPPGRAVR